MKLVWRNCVSGVDILRTICDSGARGLQEEYATKCGATIDYGEERSAQEKSIPLRARLLLIVDEEWW